MRGAPSLEAFRAEVDPGGDFYTEKELLEHYRERYPPRGGRSPRRPDCPAAGSAAAGARDARAGAGPAAHARRPAVVLARSRRGPADRGRRPSDARAARGLDPDEGARLVPGDPEGRCRGGRSGRRLGSAQRRRPGRSARGRARPASARARGGVGGHAAAGGAVRADGAPGRPDGARWQPRDEPHSWKPGSRAANDRQAIEAWIEARAAGNENTQRAYRREAERLLLWAIFERRKAMSSLTVEDAMAYRAFLRDPKPLDRWVSRKAAISAVAGVAAVSRAAVGSEAQRSR